MAPTTPKVRTPLITLGVILIIGLALGGILILAGATGPGLLTDQQTFFGLGFGLLVVAAVLIALIMTLARLIEQVADIRAEQAVMKAQLSAGDEDQHVIMVEGIGAKYANRLNRNGVVTVPQLVDMDPADVAALADVTTALAAEWQQMGRFMQLQGVGPQYAELIVRAGIGTVAELARTDPEALAATIGALQEARKVALQGASIGPDRVRRWVEAAREFLAEKQVRVAAG